jgi:Right handed beta helix region
LPFRVLAAAVAVLAFISMEAEWSRGAFESVTSKVSCDRVASTVGSNSNPGTVAKPFATVEKLAGSLRPGQTGCLRAGIYDRDVEIVKGGTTVAPVTITSFPGERATIAGRVYVAETANHLVVQQLDLDGRNEGNLPSPTVNGDFVTFRENDVTNQHTSICFLLGSREWGAARGTVIERNRIHNCGELPPTNHHHGIYVEMSDGARITDNWIYDNADRGIQLFPDAHDSYVAHNVIDGNGQGVMFSRQSSNNVVELNVITNPTIRYTLESFELTGTGNIARRNCLWSTRHWGNSGVQLEIQVPVLESLVTEPSYVAREVKDFRLQPGSPCITLQRPTVAAPAPIRQARARRGRPLRLRAATRSVWPGGRVRLWARARSSSASAATSAPLVLKVRRRGDWRPVGVMKRRGGRYVLSVRVKRLWGTERRRTLRLRAYVHGAGSSNMVVVRVRR